MNFHLNVSIIRNKTIFCFYNVSIMFTFIYFAINFEFHLKYLLHFNLTLILDMTLFRVNRYHGTCKKSESLFCLKKRTCAICTFTMILRFKFSAYVSFVISW